ncbi:MAG: efflux RND transporter permease subunit, partial [Planctomycetales bacterium]|nr:efflux RND transporter permease subunit [Planctomycetales bacterium]
LENIYDSIADWEQAGRPGGPSQRLPVIREAATEVIPAVTTAVSTTIVSFLPVFFLTGRDHKLFAPLAWTKTFALGASLLVAITVVPALARLVLFSSSQPKRRSLLVATLCAAIGVLGSHFVWRDTLVEWLGLSPIYGTLLLGTVSFAAGWLLMREQIRPLESNPASGVVRWLYAGRLRLALQHKMLMLAFPFTIFLIGLGAWVGLPTVLRPLERLASVCGAQLNEVPGYVAGKHLLPGLKSDDWIALDEGTWFYMPSLYPAASFNQAMEVLQTQDLLIKQIPEVDHVMGKIGRVDSALDPAPAAMIETYVTLKPRGDWRAEMTERKIWEQINAAATLPGVTPASPLQPIEGRIVMLQAGIKASMAIRIYGDSLDGLSLAASAVADQLRKHPLISAGTVNPDIVMGKPYYEFEVDREEASRYGMTTSMVNQIVAAGLGGVDVTTTVEGRERYPIQVRFSRSVREQFGRFEEVPVVTHADATIPLSQLTHATTSWGPGMINSENSRLVAHVTFSPNGISGDLETVESVSRALRTARENGQLEFPPGNFELQAVGSFQNQLEANQRLMWILPSVFLINLLLHYLHFRNLPISLVVFSGIPIACAGGMIAVAWMGVEMNTAVWVGFIALAGLAADDGIVMASYIHERLRRHPIETVEQLREEIYQAGLKRIRPCVMTTMTTIAALVPVLLSTGRGADVAKAMALPVFGGMLIEPFTTFVVPTVYCAYLELKLRAGFVVRPEVTRTR